MNSLRRRTIQLLGTTPLAGCAGITQAGTGTKEESVATPSEPEGPFYPVSWEGDVDGDLTRAGSASPYAEGQMLSLSGRIVRSDGSPAANAQVDIWQTDHTGRYRHPDDEGEAPLKRGFQGYGRVQTDSDGNYRFSTIKPAPYGSRPAHIHFRVSDGQLTLTTQMYFDGESEERGVFSRMSRIWAADRSPLTVKPQADSKGGLSATFDIYLS